MCLPLKLGVRLSCCPVAGFAGDEHPFFLGLQAHPEFLSRPHPNKWSPPFYGFVLASAGADAFLAAQPFPYESIAAQPRGVAAGPGRAVTPVGVLSPPHVRGGGADGEETEDRFTWKTFVLFCEMISDLMCRTEYRAVVGGWCGCCGSCGV